MKAIIMAGGQGSRLRPLTCDLPKPMVPVLNKPIMEHIINLLKKHGITEIGITLMYLPQKIKDYFGDGSNFGVNIHYFVEDTPLGTAGSVKNADEFLNDTFVVISGDGLTDMDLTKALEFHKQKESLATLILQRVEVPLEYGVVVTKDNGEITRFLEKPSWSEVFSDTANTGTYILEPEVLKYFDKGQNFDFSKDLFPTLLKNKDPMYGFVSDGYWCDIGDLRAYLQSHYDVLEGKIKLDMPGTEIKPNVWVGENTEIHPDANINGPCIIGDNCKIEKTSIEDFSIIGNNNLIEEDVSVKKSIIWNNNSIQSNSELRGTVLCDRINVKNFASVYENSVIGDDSIINERAVIKPNVKVWPQKVIDNSALVDRNIVWGSKFSKTIFGENGLYGTVNVDVSPEFATRLGAAYGSTLGKGARVAISSTNSNAARMFKYAFISGLLSVGVEVFNLSRLLTPISRHAINFLSVSGGIHVKVDDNDPNKIRADFMDNKGASISRAKERKIENSFAKEDFTRASSTDINKIINITDYKTYYMTSVLNDIDDSSIKSAKINVAIDSPSELVLDVATSMLREIGCEPINVGGLKESENEYLESIKESVLKNKYDMGVYIDNNAEKLILYDNKGNIIKDDLFSLLVSTIVFKTLDNAKVIAPITTTNALEKLAQKYNGEVVRTKNSSQAIMEEMLSSNILKNDKDNFIQFILNFDAIAGLLKIVEFIAIQKTSLNDIISSIPEFNLIKENIFCPWELKGTVMRTLVEENDKTKVELLDGVKFLFEEGWALILPDAEKPLVRIFTEGDTKEIAKQLSEKYSKKVKEIVNV